LQDVLIAVLRLAGLGIRFGLTLFLVAFFSLHDIGSYALLVGITSVLPGSVGLGLSYFYNRQIVDAQDALLPVRDRLLISVAMSCFAAVMLVVLQEVGWLGLAIGSGSLIVLLVLETLGFDLHLSLMARHRAVVANVLFFVRTAGWIPPFALIAYLDPEWRTLDALIGAWLIGLCCWSALVATWGARFLTAPRLWRTRVDFALIRATVPRAFPIWISDISLAGGQVIDRFIVSAFLGLEATGIYYFFFAIANAAVTVGQAATQQIHMPVLRKAYLGHLGSAFVEIAQTHLKKAVILTSILILASIPATYLVVALIGRPELIAHVVLMPIIAAAALFRSVAEYFGIFDYVTERDGSFVRFNIASVIATSISVTMLTALVGLMGAAVATLAVAFALSAVRFLVWRRTARGLCQDTTL
jgi:O-antigen/teichoic acid export membrane protein